MLPMDIKEMRDEYAKLDHEARELITKSAQDGLNAEETEKKDRLFKRMDTLKAAHDDMVRLASVKFEKGEAEKAAEPRAAIEYRKATEPRNFSNDEIRKGVNDYLKTGSMDPE